MPQTIHMTVKANGTDIKGETTQKSGNRENTIECVAFEYSVATAREAGSGIATGRRQHQPIKIRKRIDKASPMLAKALCENQAIDAEFKFYRPDPDGGEDDQFYTVAIKKGRINSIRQYVADALTPAANPEPPLEEVTFVFHTIHWTIADGGISHEDAWDKQR